MAASTSGSSGGGAEHAALAGDDQGFRAFRSGDAQGGHQLGAQVVAQGVDRRIGQAQQVHLAVAFMLDESLGLAHRVVSVVFNRSGSGTKLKPSRRAVPALPDARATFLRASPSRQSARPSPPKRQS
jgi:hypothetical protein